MYCSTIHIRQTTSVALASVTFIQRAVYNSMSYRMIFMRSEVVVIVSSLCKELFFTPHIKIWLTPHPHSFASNVILDFKIAIYSKKVVHFNRKTNEDLSQCNGTQFFTESVIISQMPNTYLAVMSLAPSSMHVVLKNVKRTYIQVF
jgi:hypothetical protein